MAPPSGSSYIIICNGRIRLQHANNDKERIQIISETAERVASYLGARYRSTLDIADLVPIQTAQHYLMDHGAEITKDELDAKIAEMFEMFEVLEVKYDSGTGSY